MSANKNIHKPLNFQYFPTAFTEQYEPKNNQKTFYLYHHNLSNSSPPVKLKNIQVPEHTYNISVVFQSSLRAGFTLFLGLSFLLSLRSRNFTMAPARSIVGRRCNLRSTRRILRATSEPAINAFVVSGVRNGTGEIILIS